MTNKIPMIKQTDYPDAVYNGRVPDYVATAHVFAQQGNKHYQTFIEEHTKLGQDFSPVALMSCIGQQPGDPKHVFLSGGFRLRAKDDTMRGTFAQGQEVAQLLAIFYEVWHPELKALRCNRTALMEQLRFEYLTNPEGLREWVYKYRHLGGTVVSEATRWTSHAKVTNYTKAVKELDLKECQKVEATGVPHPPNTALIEEHTEPNLLWGYPKNVEPRHRRKSNIRTNRNTTREYVRYLNDDLKEQGNPAHRITGYVLEQGKFYPHVHLTHDLGGWSPNEHTPFYECIDLALHLGHTYVEGYLATIWGTVHHAWLVNKWGQVIDPLVQEHFPHGLQGLRGRYGVEFTQSQLREYRKDPLNGTVPPLTVKIIHEAIDPHTDTLLDAIKD